MNEIEYRALQLNSIGLEEIASLLHICFPKSKKFSKEYLKWLYVDNPRGRAVGYNAYQNEQLVGHYSCIPMLAHVNGRIQKGLLSLNTATHPSHQGRGLFRKLANKTYKHSQEDGYEFVCGVANSRSTTLFVKLLKFKLISPLDVTLSVVDNLSSLDLDTVREEAEFYTLWDKKSINWRICNPVNKGRFKQERNDSVKIYCNTEYPMIINSGYGLFAQHDNIDRGTFTLNRYIRDVFSVKMCMHLIPDSVKKQRKILSFSLPDKLKPSPLNFIYRSFSGDEISAESVYFNYLDFDAY